MAHTSKGMVKRTLTGVAAASIALGMMAPASFAATAAWNYNSRTITIGNYSKNVGGIVAKDKSHFTEFIPVYYVMQGLKTLGYTVTWNGITQVLDITTPSGVVPNFRNLNPGSDGTTKIEVNGTLVQNAPRVVAKDQLTGVMTTFVPIYYLNEALNVVNVANTYNGKTWTLTQSQVSTAPKLGSITLAGQQAGTGTSASPAISNGASVSATATLTDAYGNPVTGVDLTLLAKGASQPTVTSNGQTLSGSTISGGWSYQIPTNAAGQATAQLAVPTGVAGSYTLQYQAPYTQSGANITDSVEYVTFMNANSMGITPFASSSSSPYMASVSSMSNEAAGVVPVTVTLPLLNGQPQANAPVSFTLSGAGAFFSNAQGQSFGTTGTSATVNTNSQGQANVYVNSDQTGAATVTATSGSLSPVSTYINWGQAGVASTVANLSATNATGGTAPAWTAGNSSDVTVTGTLQDALGNPVADAQLLVANQGGNTSYVNGTTSTAFPNAMPATAALVSSSGAPYGTMVTTNSSGAFSVTLTGSGTTGTYSLWTVQNGEVGNQLGSPFTIAYKGSTSAISSVGVSIANQQAQSFNNHSDAPVTTMPSTQYNMTTGGVLEIAAYNSQPGDYLFGNPNASVSYTVTGTSNGYIKSIDGVMMNGSLSGLPNNPTSVGVTLQPTMTVAAGQPTQVYKVLVNNVPIGAETVTYALPTGSGTPSGVTSIALGTLGNASGNMSGFAVPSDLGQGLGSPSNGVYSDGNLVDAVNVGVGDTGTGTANFTFTSNSASATAASTFTGGAAAQVAAVSPQASSINPGQTETVTFTLEDSSGNPVPNSLAKVTSDGSTSNLWITQVNGQPLQQSEQIGSGITTMPTPFPLFAPNGSLPSGDALGYTTVNVPNVANGILPTASSPGSTINVYTNSNGQFTLTFAAGSVSAFVTSGGVGQPQSQISNTASSGLTANFFTNSTGVVSNVSTNVYVTTSALTGNTNVGTLAW
ncbi:MAG: hypothetical protein ACYCVB_14780 [Bacilli bacterium]